MRERLIEAVASLPQTEEILRDPFWALSSCLVRRQDDYPTLVSLVLTNSRELLFFFSHHFPSSFLHATCLVPHFTP